MGPSFPLDAGQVESLSVYMQRRQAKAKALMLLKRIKDRNDLNRTDLSVAANLTFPKVAENLSTSLSRHWMTPDEFVAFLDDVETAGRQHVLIFTLPESASERVREGIRSPVETQDSLPAINDYFNTPSRPVARVLVDSADKIVVKVVAIRSYWVSIYEKDEPEEKLIRRTLEKERSAIIIKCDCSTGLIQVRVPPKEKGQGETGKSIYEFLFDALGTVYGDNVRWIRDANCFPIWDTFNNIVNNKTDFILRHDTPENLSISSRLNKKGAMTDMSDLRDDPEWHHEKGYARRQLRGHWIGPGGDPVYMHLHRDVVQVDPKTSRELARIFVPKPCHDKDLEYGISRIHAHL